MHDQQAFDLNSPPQWGVFLKRLFTEDFMPHGHCYFWRPEILWLHVISDVVIALAYYSIPVILVYFTFKRKDIPFHWMFWMFGAFIFLCGTTHLIDVLTTWVPVYRFEGVVKLITAIVSISTAIALVPIIPRMLLLPNLEGAIKDMVIKSGELEKVNKDLERFNQASLGREERIIELKREVNKLASELGRTLPYNMID